MVSALKAISNVRDSVGSEDLAKREDLRAAFDLFNQVSQQLSSSYEHLETRVADLTQELNTVSAQRMEELAAKEAIAERLESLLNVLPGGVIVIDSRGVISKVNPAAREMLGEPLEGLRWRDIIQRSFRPQDDDGHEISTRDGRRISIATSSLAEDGQIILLTDQTETRRLQSELSRHERLSALGKMVSALAHQIRTPLSAAMLYAGHLCGGHLSGQQQQTFAEKLLKRLNHMERQVQDMLVFVRGDIPLNDLVTCAELQQGIREEVEVLLSTNRVDCDWQLHCPTHQLRCQKDALVGAVLNLVHNAIQAGGAGVRLEITMYLQGEGYIGITVTDNGPGIEPAMLASVKDVFVTTKPQGTGLGLAVVESVATRHGGKFTLRSEPGQGTSATLLLPLAQLVTSSSYEAGE
ncbi:MAG: PAS domain-containing protein [Gammaproteobacteria bacterium]|uniref:sensor histidine kinase n=1 Tax=Pseudomaricurvus alcaniphilus TaxID=1166482 RepID=UPI00140A0127|nr:ATP-binding protein [Pseudomaricurvus alcaniphilus]MBR9911625.1 PAS domain-containing protein [Gammaproteobacteria bacterium]NHN39431.1 PAS domain-containing protein [Pseudomaricurvus alcaniphilus]